MLSKYKLYSPFYGKLKHTVIGKESKLNTALSKLVLLHPGLQQTSANFISDCTRHLKTQEFTQTNF